LEFRGLTVRQARRGDEAVRIAQRDRPLLVLMDLRLPGMDGWEATRRLKADPATREVIVIAVTAHAFDDDERTALEAGCDAYLAKPFDLPALADALVLIGDHGRRGLGAIARASRRTRPSTSAEPA
jgi:two-component system, cell cycle response regulator DivK